MSLKRYRADECQRNFPGHNFCRSVEVEALEKDYERALSVLRNADASLDVLLDERRQAWSTPPGKSA